MKVLGVDPGLNITGYGLVESGASGTKLVEAGVIRTSSEEHIAQRLKTIYEGLAGIIEEYRPEILVLEKVYSHYKHPATAILMAHARGVACLLCGIYGVELVNYASTHLKRSISGRGRASKSQVAGMVKSVLKLKSLPAFHDATDALALAICHVDSIAREKAACGASKEGSLP